jgi:aminoglycoside phosphotransferase (APT) family kinase protein
MEKSIDRPTAVRPSEGIDVVRLSPFLRSNLGLEGEVEVLQFPSGFSNLTYLLRVGGTEIVLRRPPFGSKPKTGHDMAREHTVLEALKGAFPYCPKPLLLCEDESVIGCPFYLMERVRGIIVRREFPRELALSPDDIGVLFRRLVDVHVELHSVDYRAVGLGDFGKPEGYVERQVAGWSERYRRARTPDVPDCEGIMGWLEKNRPADSGRGCIIHNDFRLDNLVLDEKDPLQIIGVLDWEMATIGDPLMDLGASLAYWVERDDPPEIQAMSMVPTNAEGAPTRAEVVKHYSATSGIEIGDFSFYYCYGLFRLAVIVQQIYYRSYHGQTEDSRFSHLNHWVGALAGAAQAATD